MKFKVIVREAEEGGFWAEVPATPGCASQGETLEELLANVREAIEGCLSVEVIAPASEESARVVEGTGEVMTVLRSERGRTGHAREFRARGLAIPQPHSRLSSGLDPQPQRLAQQSLV